MAFASLSPFQVLISSCARGLCLEVIFSSLAWMLQRSIVKEWNHVPAAATTNRKWMRISIVAACNITGGSYAVLQILQNMAASPAACQSFSLLANSFSHLFLISFDTFNVFKTTLVANKAPWTIYTSIFLLLHRIGWMIADVRRSYGIWDRQSGCIYVQDPVTGAGYNVADLLMDMFCTTVSMFVAFRKLDWSIGVTKALVEENVLRTMITTIMTVILVYTSLSNASVYCNMLAWACQIYIIARFVNLGAFKREMKTARRKMDTAMKLEQFLTGVTRSVSPHFTAVNGSQNAKQLLGYPVSTKGATQTSGSS